MKLPGHPEILGLGTGALGAHHVCEGLSSEHMKTPKMALKPRGSRGNSSLGFLRGHNDQDFLCIIINMLVAASHVPHRLI